ncbi:hypothetical protein HAX54_026997 [Datura stramonium]|uniref:Uncharacterized protein n=1 Tax=Datura stramonium TaxID=4076 RepID=A0ABS8S8C9_DATST|nr:hypothetical protein [Datura stramonium]
MNIAKQSIQLTNSTSNMCNYSNRGAQKFSIKKLLFKIENPEVTKYLHQWSVIRQTRRFPSPSPDEKYLGFPDDCHLGFISANP